MSGQCHIRARAILAVLALASCDSGAQSVTASHADPAPLHAYDVGTVKLNTSRAGEVQFRMEGNRFIATNTPLDLLIQSAFGVRQELSLGLPKWAHTTRFDIQAKATDLSGMNSSILPEEERRLMEKDFITRRFGLCGTQRCEQYLCTNRWWTRGGSRLKAAQSTPKHTSAQDGLVQDGTNVTGTDVGLAPLVDRLSEELHVPVLDRTGLTGQYDYSLRWTREEQRVAVKDAESTSADAPSLFAAVQEQLGLRIISARRAVPAIVIDRLQMPSAN